MQMSGEDADLLARNVQALRMRIQQTQQNLQNLEYSDQAPTRLSKQETSKSKYKSQSQGNKPTGSSYSYRYQ